MAPGTMLGLLGVVPGAVPGVVPGDNVGGGCWEEGGDKIAWAGNVAGGELPYDVDVAGCSAPD
jgi:hypothetical protein